MHNAVLLAQLKALLACTPDFTHYSPKSLEHQAWLGKAHALVARWDKLEAVSIASASDFMTLPLLRDSNVAKVVGLIHRSIAHLELESAGEVGKVIAAGATYDFFKALNEVISSAQSSLLIIDPYLDDKIFDAYLQDLPAGVAVRLLAHNYRARLKPALLAYTQQHGRSVNIRTSAGFHDRVIFVDDLSCWVLGQSINKAATTKPTYILPLAPDIATLKRSHYEPIWSTATAL